jgi:hypothetical protein
MPVGTGVGCDAPRNDEAIDSRDAYNDTDSETDSSAVLVNAPNKDSDNQLGEKNAADVLKGKILSSVTAKRYATSAIFCLPLQSRCIKSTSGLT